jgi:hypothetical protein
LVSRQSLVASVCCAAITVAGCWPKKEPQIIDPADLDKITLGDVVRLSDLLREPAEKVCLLSPYLDRLDETEPLAGQVNAHLKAMDLTLQRGAFALVLVKGDKVSVQLLGAARHNMQRWHEAAGRVAKRLGCADADRVLVTKVHDLWPALVIVEEK